jgi:hypothetical protein
MGLGAGNPVAVVARSSFLSCKKENAPLQLPFAPSLPFSHHFHISGATLGDLPHELFPQNSQNDVAMATA